MSIAEVRRSKAGASELGRRARSEAMASAQTAAVSRSGSDLPKGGCGTTTAGWQSRRHPATRTTRSRPRSPRTSAAGISRAGISWTPRSEEGRAFSRGRRVGSKSY